MGRYIFLAGIIYIAISSCSTIREDRDECPCWSTIDFSQVDSSISSLHIWFLSEDDELLLRDTLFPDNYGIPYNVELERGKLRYYVWGNIRSCMELNDIGKSSSTLFRRDSSEADSLFFYGNCIDAAGESCCDTVIVGKEHICVEVVLLGVAEEIGLPVLELSGAASGYRIDRTIVDGESPIVATPVVDNSGNYRFNFVMTRQSSMEKVVFSLFFEREGGERIESVEEYPLGRVMESSGFDMERKDLADVKIVIDTSLGLFTLKCEDWHSVSPIKIRF